MNMMDKCRREEKKNLAHPIDGQSLYANRIVDNQTANKRCYEKNQNVNIVEGFGFSSVWSALVWIAIIIAIIFVALYIYDGRYQKVSLFDDIREKLHLKSSVSKEQLGGFTEIMEMLK
jgi:hypothetical protein